MTDCETFRILKSLKRHSGKGCPFTRNCDGATCQLPVAQKAVATLTPSVETAEDHQQNQATAVALLQYLRTS